MRAMRAGYWTLRFDYASIMHDWPTVEAAILARRTRSLSHAVVG